MQGRGQRIIRARPLKAASRESPADRMAKSLTPKAWAPARRRWRIRTRSHAATTTIPAARAVKPARHLSRAASGRCRDLASSLDSDVVVGFKLGYIRARGRCGTGTDLPATKRSDSVGRE